MTVEAPAKVDPKLWRYIVRTGIEDARTIIETNFEQNPDYRFNLPYHNWLHSLKVRRRGATIIDVLKFKDSQSVSLEDKVLTELAAIYHDTVQNWTEENGRRVMHTGENERESAKLALAFMDSTLLFSKDQKAAVKDAILTTQPGWQDGTVIQPLLTPSCGIVTWAVAMADTRGCLIDGPLSFVPEGDALFREINMDIMATLVEKGPNRISGRDQRKYRDRMFAWMDGQIKFVEGAQRRLDRDLTCVRESARNEVGKLFDQGDNSKDFLRKEISARKDLSFDQLINAFGYIL